MLERKKETIQYFYGKIIYFPPPKESIQTPVPLTEPDAPGCFLLSKILTVLISVFCGIGEKIYFGHTIWKYLLKLSNFWYLLGFFVCLFFPLLCRLYGETKSL